MDFQFAFGNPRGKHRKKRLAKPKKGSKLKRKRQGHGARHLKIVKVKGGPVLAKRRKHRRIKKAAHKAKHVSHKRRHHKRRRNPAYLEWTKKGESGKTLRDRSGQFMTDKEFKAATAKADRLKAAYKKKPSKKLESQLKAVEKKLDRAIENESREVSAAQRRKEDGWKVRGPINIKSKKRKKKHMARRKKRKTRKHSKRAKSKKIHAAPKRRHHKRRRRAKTYTHRHSRKTKHLKKGQSLSGVIYSKGKGRKRLKARVRIKFNPFGGLSKMDPVLQEWLGHDMEDAGALVLGGLVYGTFNSLLAQYVPSVASMLSSLPVVGPSLAPLIGGALLHKFANHIAPLRMLGEGLVGASIVGMGVGISQQIPGLAPTSTIAAATVTGTVAPATTVAGINYTPYGMNGINYTPYAGVDYTPNRNMGILPRGLSGMGIMPEPMGHSSPDFGSADYGGGAGYTEAHKFSPADFGAEDEYVGLGNGPESQMG